MKDRNSNYRYESGENFNNNQLKYKLDELGVIFDRALDRVKLIELYDTHMSLKEPRIHEKPTKKIGEVDALSNHEVKSQMNDFQYPLIRNNTIFPGELTANQRKSVFQVKILQEEKSIRIGNNGPNSALNSDNEYTSKLMEERMQLNKSNFGQENSEKEIRKLPTHKVKLENNKIFGKLDEVGKTHPRNFSYSELQQHQAKDLDLNRDYYKPLQVGNTWVQTRFGVQNRLQNESNFQRNNNSSAPKIEIHNDRYSSTSDNCQNNKEWEFFYIKITFGLLAIPLFFLIQQNLTSNFSEVQRLLESNQPISFGLLLISFLFVIYCFVVYRKQNFVAKICTSIRENLRKMSNEGGSSNPGINEEQVVSEYSSLYYFSDTQFRSDILPEIILQLRVDLNIIEIIQPKDQFSSFIVWKWMDLG